MLFPATERARRRRRGALLVHPAGDPDRIGTRPAARSDHFVLTRLADSQSATLETPGADENVITIPVELPTDEHVRLVVQRLDRYGHDPNRITRKPTVTDILLDPRPG